MTLARRAALLCTLQAEGWHILSVPLHHWQLLTGREERRSWLLRRVECARTKLA